MPLFEKILLIGPVLLFSVIAHEIAHGYAALRQGDPTAQRLGRLTWNPIRHIDPWMTILLPGMLFVATHGQMMLGGAKPVPVDPRNYRSYKRGDIIVSLAGVATNLVIAVACAALLFVVGMIARSAAGAVGALSFVQGMLFYGVLLNLALILFNLIPIPPLDGSHVAKYLLPPGLALQYQRIGFLGLVILLLLLNTRLFDYWMSPAYLAAGWVLGGLQRSGLVAADLGRWLQ